MAKIFIVDDELPVRRLLDKILKESGYTCWLANNALTARRDGKTTIRFVAHRYSYAGRIRYTLAAHEARLSKKCI